MRQFHAFQLWYLIPGVLLVAASVHIPIDYLHKQLFWGKAQAKIGEREEQGSAPNVKVFYNLSFEDESGTIQNILSNDDNLFPDDGYVELVWIYYDPSNPERIEVVNHARYLLILFLPFGLFVSYLGWPEKSTAQNNGIAARK